MLKKAKKIPKGQFVLAHLAPDRTGGRVYEHFCGRGDEGPIYNASGCQVQVECVVARTYPADPFHLAIKMGDQWYMLAKVKHEDPGIAALYESGAMVDYGPSPHQIERRERHEAAQREVDESQEASQRAIREQMRQRSLPRHLRTTR